jgi:hypothetical protein
VSAAESDDLATGKPEGASWNEAVLIMKERQHLAALQLAPD